jgi:hypothetical protein
MLYRVISFCETILFRCRWRDGDSTAAADVPAAQPAVADHAAAQPAVADSAALQPAVADNAADNEGAAGDPVPARTHHAHHAAQTCGHHRSGGRLIIAVFRVDCRLCYSFIGSVHVGQDPTIEDRPRIRVRIRPRQKSIQSIYVRHPLEHFYNPNKCITVHVRTRT